MDKILKTIKNMGNTITSICKTIISMGRTIINTGKTIISIGKTIISVVRNQEIKVTDRKMESLKKEAAGDLAMFV